MHRQYIEWESWHAGDDDVPQEIRLHRIQIMAQERRSQGAGGLLATAVRWSDLLKLPVASLSAHTREVVDWLWRFRASNPSPSKAPCQVALLCVAKMHPLTLAQSSTLAECFEERQIGQAGCRLHVAARLAAAQALSQACVGEATQEASV